MFPVTVIGFPAGSSDDQSSGTDSISLARAYKRWPGSAYCPQVAPRTISRCVPASTSSIATRALAKLTVLQRVNRSDLRPGTACGQRWLVSSRAKSGFVIACGVPP
jgi:hypothetical protein